MCICYYVLQTYERIVLRRFYFCRVTVLNIPLSLASLAQERILTSWVALVDKSGIYEHYNPLTGEAYGAVGLGMSTLVCDWIYKYGWDKL